MEIPSLTREYLESLVISKEFVHKDNLVTVCFLHLQPDYYLIGKSGVLDRSRFDASVGEKFAYEDAISQMWQILGYYRIAKQVGF